MSRQRPMAPQAHRVEGGGDLAAALSSPPADVPADTGLDPGDGGVKLNGLHIATAVPP